MNKFIANGFTLASTLLLMSCSAFGPQAPSPKQVSFKVAQIESGATMSAIGIMPMDVPNQRQPIITNDIVFRVTTDVLGNPNSSVLIPQDSLLQGVYYNNGKNCYISWQSLYGDYRGMELHQGDSGIASRVNDTICNPQTGIKPGDVIQITFK